MNNDASQARMIAEQDAQTDVSKILWVVVGFFINLIASSLPISISRHRLLQG